LPFYVLHNVDILLGALIAGKIIRCDICDR